MRTGIRIALFLLLLFTFGYILYFPYKQVRVQTVNKLNEKQMLFARQAATAIEFFFREQMTLVRELASDPEIAALSDQGKKAIDRVQINHSDYISGVSRYDRNGIITYSYPNPEKVVGRDISAQPHVKKLLKYRKPNISDVFLSVQGFQTVALSVPVYKDGVFDGAFAFLIDFKYIARTYLEVIRIGDDGYAWMISRDGVELYCPVPGHVGVNISDTSKSFPSVLNLSEKMKRGMSGYGTYSYDMTKDRKTTTITKHAAYAPVRLEDNLWSIAVATPESEIYNELQSFYKKMLIALVALFGASAIVAYIMIRDYQLKKLNTELEKRISEEIEKRKKQEKIMLQQARFCSIGETLNAIAHQWRQPLNAVGLCVQDIEDTYKSGRMDEKYLTETVETAMNNLEGLSQVIDNFRTFFTPQERAVMTDLCGLIKSLYVIIHAQLDAENISFSFLTDADETQDRFSAVIFPDMLKQVILICLQNSKEAIVKRGVKGEISLTLSKENDVFTITITDNGGGIPPEIIDNIFDPYFSTKGINIGTGIGLYTAKGIMEEHFNGSVTLTNHLDGAKAEISFKAGN